MDANQPLLDLLHGFAGKKGVTPAQISLAWMLHKWEFLVPIPGMRTDLQQKMPLCGANPARETL